MDISEAEKRLQHIVDEMRMKDPTFIPTKKSRFRLIPWIKNLFKKPFKPGLPKNARPVYGTYEVAPSLSERIEFTEKVSGIKIPAEDRKKIKTEGAWRAYKHSQKFIDMADNATVLTKEEIDRHVVTDWDWATKGFDEEQFLRYVCCHMERYLKKNGDVCMLPDFFIGANPSDDHQRKKMGLINIKGKIKLFIAH